MYIYIYVYICIYIYVNMCVHVGIYIYIFVIIHTLHIYTCLYIYIYICTNRSTGTDRFVISINMIYFMFSINQKIDSARWMLRSSHVDFESVLSGLPTGTIVDIQLITDGRSSGS